MTTEDRRALARAMDVFWVELVLPRKNYTVGDQIDYEVIVHNPDGRSIQFLTITLYQNILEVLNKNGGISSKVNTLVVNSRTTRRRTARAYAIGENWNWKDSLEVPNMISPSMAASTSQLNEEGGVQVAGIQYFLKVQAFPWSKLWQAFPFTSGDYPIQIQSASRAVLTRNSISASSSNLQFEPSAPSIEQLLRRSGSGPESIASTPQHFPLRQLLGRGDPPRYSELSLPALNYGIMSGSLETLPPNYEDIILQ